MALSLLSISDMNERIAIDALHTMSPQLAAVLALCSSEAERRVMLEQWGIADGFYTPAVQERPHFGAVLMKRMRSGDLLCAVHCEQIWIDRGL